MELWRQTWREGFAPVISTRALRHLRDALVKDSVRLVQGKTTLPLPIWAAKQEEVIAACAIGLCGWEGEKKTVMEVEEYFAKTCFAADQRLGHPGDCRHFLNWFDDTPRPDMIRELLPEVELALAERSGGSASCQQNCRCPGTRSAEDSGAPGTVDSICSPAETRSESSSPPSTGTTASE